MGIPNTIPRESSDDAELRIPITPASAQCSSRTTAAIEAGKFCKEKDRSSDKTVWEYLMLEFLSELLNTYNTDPLVEINAPRPYALSINDGIIMEFCPGYSVRFAATKMGYRNKLIAKDGTEWSFPDMLAYAIGRLCGIKDVEGLKHSDFRKDHMLFDPMKPRLAVVDLENLCLDRNNAETADMRTDILKGYSFSPQLGELFDKGHDSVEPIRGVQESIISKLENKYGLFMILDDKTFVKSQ